MDLKKISSWDCFDWWWIIIKNIDLLTEYQTGLAARIGYPTEHLSSHYMDEVSNPMFATSIGLLYEGLRNIKPKIAAPKFNKLDVFNLDESMEEPVVEDEKVYAKRKIGLAERSIKDIPL